MEKSVFAHNTRTLPHGGPSPLPASPPGFELLEEIGRGGMGIVCRAHDRMLDREVAVKLLQGQYAPDSAMAARFVDEARITGQLQHPSIPAVYHVGATAESRPFLAMKLIKGDTLDTLVKERRVPNALAVFEAVAQAVGYAHAHDVIHRDLKPSNVMVGAFGEVQVMDWGLAKVLSASRPSEQPEADPDATAARTEIRTARDSDGPLTQAGSVLGTPAFMAPEQAAGETDKVDRRSDVFGLGAILCALLTGRPPFTGGDAEAVRLNAVRGKTEEAFARLDACGADPDVVSLCKRCLAFEPAERPADAGELAARVAELRRDADERARQAELSRAKAEVQAAEQRKRRRVQLALAFSILVLMAVIGSIAWWQDRQANERRTEQRLAEDRRSQAIKLALDHAEAALRKPNPVYGEIDAALKQAEQRLAEAEPGELAERHARLLADRRMLARLEVARYGPYTQMSHREMLERRAKGLRNDYYERGYSTAFREYGFDFGRDTPTAIADRVRQSAIAPQLVTALYDWMLKDGKHASRQLCDVCAALIPELHLDPTQTAFFFNAWIDQDAAKIAQLAPRLNGRTLPPWMADLIGGSPLTPTDDALRILREAQSAHPQNFWLASAVHYRLPFDRLDERIAYLRIAQAIRPDAWITWYALAADLMVKKDDHAAVVALRECVRLDPTNADAWCWLGGTLSRTGERYRDEVAAAFREGIRLTLENIAAGREPPEKRADTPRLTWASFMFAERGEPLAGLRAIQVIAHRDPEQMAAPRNWQQYNAGCYALRCADGQGKDVPPPAERPAYRRQAYEYLSAELGATRELAAADRAFVHKRMQHWLADADLASVRDPGRVGSLPPGEGDRWVKLWSEVRELLDSTAPPTGGPE